MNRFTCVLVGFAISCGGSQASSPKSPINEHETAPMNSTMNSTDSGHESGMQAGEPRDDHSHDLPPALDAFHNTLKPLWHAKGDTRVADACAGVESLKQKADGVIAASVPEQASADADGWKMAAEGLASSLANLESQCAKGLQDSGFEDSFKAVHDAFHVLVEKLGHKK